MDKTRKLYGKLFLSSMSCVILLILFINIAFPDREFSDMENRYLSLFPGFKEMKNVNGGYLKKLDSWFQDQFAGRDRIITAGTYFEKLLGRNEINGVFPVRHDMLIFRYTENTQEVTSEKASAVNAFADALPDAEFSFIMVPNKAEIYRDFLPENYSGERQEEYINEFYSLIDGRIIKINPTQSLKEVRDDYIFFNTDHHWTQKGAFTAFQDYTKMTGKEFSGSDEYDVVRAAGNFYGTLSSKTGLYGKADGLDLFIPKINQDYIVSIPSEKKKMTGVYDTEKLNGKDLYTTFLGGNYDILTIETDLPGEESLMVIKDSYANAFIPFLLKYYPRITVVDLRYFSGDLLRLADDYRITEVLFLFNVNTFSDDDSILNLLSYTENHKGQ